MTPRQLEVLGIGLASSQCQLKGVPFPNLSALLPAARVTSMSCPFRSGEPHPSGAPGDATGITDTKEIPRSTVPPSRCSHAFLQQISVLATGKGEKQYVSLWEQNGQKKKHTFV